MLIHLVHGEPIRFGADNEKGVVMGTDGQLRIVEVADVGEDALLVHDEHHADPGLAFALSRLSHSPTTPTPIGVFRDVDRAEFASETSRQLMLAEREGPRRPGRPARLGRHLGRQLASSMRKTVPVFGLGAKNVVFGGMSFPAWAVAAI